MFQRPPRFTAPALWAVLVGAASVTPVSGGTALETPAGVPLDVVAHLVGYAVLAALLVRADTPLTRAIVVAAVFGLGVEGLQAFAPTRTPSALDALVNLVGAVVGALAATAWRAR